MRKKSMVMLFVIFFISFFAFSLKVKADCEPSCPYTNCTQECSGDDGSCWDFLWKAWHQNPDSIFTTHYDACSLDGADLVKKECTETGNEQDVTLNCTLTCMEGGGVEGVALCCEDYGGAVDTVDCGSTIEGDVDNDGDVDCMDYHTVNQAYENGVIFNSSNCCLDLAGGTRGVVDNDDVQRITELLQGLELSDPSWNCYICGEDHCDACSNSTLCADSGCTWETDSCVPCVPDTCETLGKECGTNYDDNCGGTIDCSSCLGDLSYCSEGICVECISADDCEDDGIACTVESCENNQCVHDTSSCLDINLDPENASIEPGEQLIYRTLLYYGNGTSRENISGAIYTSSDEGIVSIDNNIVEGVTEGTVTITVSYTEDYGGGELTVNDSVQLDVVAEGSSYLSHIEISPEESTIQIGSTQPYTVTAYYSGGSSEDVSDVAFLMSLDGIVASTMIAEGVGATGMQEGVATILASYGVIYDEENHTIKEDSAVLHVACVDGDSDGVCDWDEPEGCSVQNVNNLPANTSCLYYYGFNTLTGCWISGFYEGKICGSTEEYACSDDLSKIEKRTYSLECSVGGCTKPSYDTTVVVEETCVTIEECDGPVNSTELGDYECDCRVDSDNDDVCEDYRGTAGKDDCIGQAPSGGAPSIPTEYTSQCNQYEFSYTTGCWELKHINVDVPFVSENCTEAICYEDTSVYMKCNLEGKEIPHSEGCDQMIENCGGDPDFSKENCTLYFSKSDDDIICQDHEWNCWSKHTASTYLGGDSYCCGDDGSEECWIDAADNACCWSNLLEKVAYLSDPDESVIYCGLLGEKLGAFNAVNCDEGETYCWDPVSRQCCGDDEDETWEYSTSRKLGDVLVNETCYGGRWVVVWREETTYFDLWSLFMKIFE